MSTEQEGSQPSPTQPASSNGPEVQGRPGAVTLDAEGIWAAAASLAILIGSIGPWASAGPFSASGTDGDGVITLVLGIAIAVFALRATAPILMGLLGGLVAAIGVYDIVNISQPDGAALISASPGWGLIIVAIGGLAIVALAWRRVVSRSRAKASAPSPEPFGPDTSGK